MAITLHDTHGHSHAGAGHSHSHGAVREERSGDADSEQCSGEDLEAQALVPKVQRKTNINVRAAFIHVLGDIIQSAGVLTAAFIIFYKVCDVRDLCAVFLSTHEQSDCDSGFPHRKHIRGKYSYF